MKVETDDPTVIKALQSQKQLDLNRLPEFRTVSPNILYFFQLIACENEYMTFNYLNKHRLKVNIVQNYRQVNRSRIRINDRSRLTKAKFQKIITYLCSMLPTPTVSSSFQPSRNTMLDQPGTRQKLSHGSVNLSGYEPFLNNC